MTNARILSASWSERPVTMRLPFQFGNTEVRETAEAWCAVEIEVDGRRVRGASAQLMVPRWFDKRPGLSNAETIDALRTTVDAAVGAAPDRRGSALAITRELRQDVIRAESALPALAAGFGPALVEMALVDALCRAAGLPFWKAAAADLFGLVDGRPEDLTARALTASLSTIRAPRRITVRHTVGFDAPLTRDAVGPDAPRDGLPVSLEEVIARTGVSAFKIKLKGDPQADLARLRAIAGLLEPLADYTATLDANEQYAPATFGDFLAVLDEDPALGRLRRAVRFVEQPFARETALDMEVGAPLPLVIDESDDREDAFARALVRGWAGTSIKSCKGVLRALLNKARAEAAGAILSGEDLTCQPGLCWQQDTAMAAACGVRDIERNGHHFGGGMQGSSEAETSARLELHPDIYTRIDGRPSLRFDSGEVRIGSLDRPGFGHVFAAGTID